MTTTIFSIDGPIWRLGKKEACKWLPSHANLVTVISVYQKKKKIVTLISSPLWWLKNKKSR